jgi:hypothetical protein
MKAGCIDTDGIFLIELPEWKALYQVKQENGSIAKVVMTTNAEEKYRHVAASDYMLLMAAPMLPKSCKIVKDNNILKNETSMYTFMDSFYYEFVSVFGDVEFECNVVSDADIAASFTKVAALNPIEIPQGMEYLCNGAKFIQAFTDNSASTSAAPATDNRFERINLLVKALFNHSAFTHHDWWLLNYGLIYKLINILQIVKA